MPASTRIFVALVFLCGGCGEGQKVPLSQAPKALLPLIEKLRDPDFNVRMQAAKELGARGSSAAGAAPFLAEALKDPAVKVRVWAALALGEMGPDAKMAVPALKEASLHNEWREPREAAAQALQQIQGER